MKTLLFLCALSASIVSYAAEESKSGKIILPDMLPATLILRNKPNKIDETLSRYNWVKDPSGEYVGFLKFDYWDKKLRHPKLSRRMSFGEYPK